MAKQKTDKASNPDKKLRIVAERNWPTWEFRPGLYPNDGSPQAKLGAIVELDEAGLPLRHICHEVLASDAAVIIDSREARLLFESALAQQGHGAAVDLRTLNPYLPEPLLAIADADQARPVITDYYERLDNALHESAGFFGVVSQPKDEAFAYFVVNLHNGTEVESVIYKLERASGKYVPFKEWTFSRTRLKGETRGDLSLKEAREAEQMGLVHHFTDAPDVADCAVAPPDELAGQTEAIEAVEAVKLPVGALDGLI